jgi:hypothetical protein
VNPGYFALQLGLATAMMVGAIVAGAFLLRQASTRRRNGLSAPSDRERGYEARSSVELPNAKARKARGVEVSRLDESVIAAVKPLDLALHDLNERVTELQAKVDVSGRMLAKLGSPPRRNTPSEETVSTAAEEKVGAVSEQKERAATNAMIRELAQQLGALKNELSTLKQAVEGLEAPKARSVVETPKAISAVEEPTTLRPSDTQKLAAAVEEPTTLRPSDTQKLAALLRAMTIEGHATTSGRQASSGDSLRAPVCAMNPYPMGLGITQAEGGSGRPEVRAESLRLVLTHTG